MTDQGSSTLKTDTRKSTTEISQWFWLAAVLLLTILALYPSLQGEWVNWDDQLYVTQNSTIRDFSFTGILNLFDPANAVLDTYTPMTLVSFAVDYHFVQDSAAWYHVENLLLHLVNAALVFQIILLLTGRLPLAFFVAALFGVHPMHVESVAWVSERKDVLFSLFFLASCLQYIVYLQRSRGQAGRPDRAYWVAFALAVLAMLAKPQAVSLPLVLVLLHYWESGSLKLNAWGRVLPFFGLALATGFLAIFTMDANPSGFDLLSRMAMSGHAVWTYLFKVVVPLNLMHDMGRPEAGEIPGFYYLTTLLSISILGAALWFGRRERYFVFGVGFFVVTLFFSLHLLKVNSGIAYERFSYLPYIGLFLIGGFLLQKLKERMAFGTVAMLGLMALVLIPLTVLANQRSRVWKNDATLWSDALKKNLDHPVAWCKRARYYTSIGLFEQALVDQNECLRVHPDRSSGLHNRGNIYKGMGEIASAISDYTSAIEEGPERSLPYSSRGVLLIQTGNSDGLADLKRAVELSPELVAYRLNLGLAYEVYDRFDLAQIEYSAAIELDPNDFQALKYRGSLLRIMGDLERARIDLSKAVEIRPDYGDAWYVLSKTNDALGNTQKALSQLEIAMEQGVEPDPAYLQKLKRVAL